MAGLNLLPWREKAREEKKKQFFGLAGASALLAAAGVFGAQQYVQASIENQDQRNAFLTQEIAQLDKQIKEIEALDATRQALLDRMQVIDDLQSTRPAIVHLFDEMVNAMPKGMYLLHLKQEGTKVQLEGKAESYARVSSYMNRLDASQWLSSSNLNIISTEKDAKEAADTILLRDFKLDVTQLLRQGQEAEEAATAPTTGKPNKAPTPAKKPEAGK